MNNQRLTDEELSQIRERAEKAVYAPWRIGKRSPNGLYNVGSTDGLLTAQTTNEANAAFIANAREDIPKLLVEIEYAKELLGRAYKNMITQENFQDESVYGEVREYLNGGDSG